MLRAILALAVAPLLAAAAPVDLRCMGSRAVPGAQFCNIEPVAAGLRATVCQEQKPPQSYRWTSRGWIRDSVVAVPHQGRTSAREKARQRCAALVPPPTISMEEAVRLRPHLRFGPNLGLEIGGCVETPDAVFFGISFYEGEGEDGVGGIGRYDRRTKKVVVRRHPFLLDKSIDEMVMDGEAIWLTLNQHYEGDDVPHGVARYDWAADSLDVVKESGEGPCGFDASQLTVAGGRLWVRTELDLASLDLATGVWDHVMPSPSGPVTASCRWLDERIVALMHREPCMSDRTGETVLDYMAAFRPASLIALMSARPAASWSTWEARALARGARSFDELDRVVLRPLGLSRTPPSLVRRRGGEWVSRSPEEQRRFDMLNSIVAAYGERRSTEPRWRDYLLRARAGYELRWFRGDERVACALTEQLADDSSRADYLVDVAGSHAVSALMATLDSKSESDPDRSYARIIGALERAAHQMLLASGEPYRLPVDSDTPGYDIDTPTADQQHSAVLGWSLRSNAERQQIIQRWKSWWHAHGGEAMWHPSVCPARP